MSDRYYVPRKTSTAHPAEPDVDPRLREIQRLRANAAPLVQRDLDRQAAAIQLELRRKDEASRRLQAVGGDIEEAQLDAEVARLKIARMRERNRARFVLALCGLGLCVGAFWVFLAGPEVRTKPLATLTLGEIGGALASSIVALALAGAGLSLVFGVGKKTQEDASDSELDQLAAASWRRRGRGVEASRDKTWTPERVSWVVFAFLAIAFLWASVSTSIGR